MRTPERLRTQEQSIFNCLFFVTEIEDPLLTKVE